MISKVTKGLKERVIQGDIFKNVEMIEYAQELEGFIEISKIVFPLAVVLTQDCDLEGNFRDRFCRNASEKSIHDKWLISVLMAPLYNFEHVCSGTHLSELGITMQEIKRNKTHGHNLMNNQQPRYHFVNFPDSIPIVDSVVDFKHHFTVNSRYIQKCRKSNFVCRLKPLYRENLSQRFSAFLSRIGLPDS